MTFEDNPMSGLNRFGLGIARRGRLIAHVHRGVTRLKRFEQAE